MPLKVIAPFFHKATGRYIAAGDPCPDLDAETAARLVKAGCLAVGPGSKDGASETSAPPAPSGPAAEPPKGEAAPTAAPKRRGRPQKDATPAAQG